ncbi:hypothetical protein P3T42_002198 [Paraburkholderia sp. GAS38]|uniref:hypothetical protein n=1 Tax=Paraburkholderia sp. GAS38 TaxID=3035133 RepID=UPI003D245479
MTTQATLSEKGRVIASANRVKEALEQTDRRKYDDERVAASTGGAVYLIMNGLLQWIPNPPTYENLFVSWDGVVVSDYLVDNVPPGPALTSGAVLSKGDSSAPVYLVTNNHKQWIPDEAAFNKFAFNSAKIAIVPQVVIDYVPAGPNVG